VYDPVAKLPADLHYQSVKANIELEEAVQDADAVFLCTEWPIFRNVDWAKMKSIMNQPNMFDGRNLLDPHEMISIGYFYQGIGYE
jgi:UDPglucose 6-dehydrogenase